MKNPEFVVYRYFDANGALIYVGYTSNLHRRTREHHMDTWWPDVVSRNVEQFPDERTARAAETVAIRMENPTHNMLGVTRSEVIERTPEESKAFIAQLEQRLRSRFTA